MGIETSGMKTWDEKPSNLEREIEKENRELG